MKTRLALLCLAAVLSAGRVHGVLPQAPSTMWNLEEVADGVWAALQPAENRFDDSNSVIILAGREVIVIDAQSNPGAVRQLIGEVGRVARRPVRYLINTHWHGDHTQGNPAYREAYGEGLMILGHATLLQDVPARAGGFIDEQVDYLDRELPGARERLAAGVDREGAELDEGRRQEAAASIAAAEEFLRLNRDVEFLAPDLAYGDSILLNRGGRRIQLIHVRGHTRGDTVVFLPEERLLLTGDLVDALPFVGHGYPAEWVAALEALRELEFDTIVPGHGPVYLGKKQLDQVLGFLRDLVNQTRAAVDAEMDLEQTLATVDLSRWREALAVDETAEVFFDQVLPAAVERAWLEARGELEN